VTSFPVTLLPPPASYSSVEAQTQNPSVPLSTVTSRWLPVKRRDFQVASGRARSRDVISCHMTATSCSSPNKQNPSFSLSTATSRWPPVKWRHFRGTCSRAWSRDVIYCHVTATSCELQPCRSSNALKTRVFGLFLPLPGDFRWNDVTCELLPAAPGHDTSFPVTWLPPPVSYSPVRAQMYTKSQFTAFYCHFQVTCGAMTSLLGHFRPHQVTWRDFLSCDCHIQLVTAL